MNRHHIEPPTYRGYDITKDAFCEQFYVNDARNGLTWGSDGRFTTELAARAFIDTLPDLTEEVGQ